MQLCLVLLLCSCLYRTVLKCFLDLLGVISHTPVTPTTWLALAESLCQCVQVASSKDHYNLSLLEAALECLLHLSAEYV